MAVVIARTVDSPKKFLVVTESKYVYEANGNSIGGLEVKNGKVIGGVFRNENERMISPKNPEEEKGIRKFFSNTAKQLSQQLNRRVQFDYPDVKEGRMVTKYRISSGKVGFVKGGSNPGETVQMTAAREFGEEVGRIPQHMFVVQNSTTSHETSNRTLVLLNIDAGMKDYINNAIARRSEEHIGEVFDHKFVTFQELSGMNLNQTTREVIEDFADVIQSGGKRRKSRRRKTKARKTKKHY